MKKFFIILTLTLLCALASQAQVTTQGFLNLPRAEAPGTLLSHPDNNDSEAIGRTTTLNYLNGWLIVGPEAPGSRVGSDLQLRVYDISNPTSPIRRLPSDFGHTNYPDNSWKYNNSGWNAHATAQSGTSTVPDTMWVPNFGGTVERGIHNIENSAPNERDFLYGSGRSAQAGPWHASMQWYSSPDKDFVIDRIWRVTNYDGTYYNQWQRVATFGHVGQYGGGDWHPIFFGDLLIYVRSGSSDHDGVVVYRLQYNNFDDAVNRTITPQFVASLPGGFQGYWPNLFSDGSGLYVTGSATNILMAADITAAADPTADPAVNLAASLNVPGFSNASYPAYQDNFGFIHNRKINMTKFLAGDANPIELTLNEGPPNLVNTSQMSLPLGNLWVTGGYPFEHGSSQYVRQGMAIWVHQQAPDTTAPRVSFHIPQVNRTSYPRHAPLSFLVHERPRHGGPRNGIDFSVRPVGAGGALGAFVPGFIIHDFAGCMTFTPTTALAADTTYQVDFHSSAASQIGFCDAAGNYIEPYSYRFSTGGGINATAPPVITSVTPNKNIPAPNENITVTTTATGVGPLNYRYNFEGTWTAWSATNTASYTYTTAGRPRVLVQVRDANGQIANGSVRLLVIEPLPSGPRPTHSGTMAIGDDAPGERRLWTVNPDANTVSVLNAITGEKLNEYPVGKDPRNIARDANGRYWITCQDSDEIRVLNSNGTTHATIPLAFGSAPFGVAASPNGQYLYATMYGSARIHRYTAANPLAAPINTATVPTPRAIAVSADGLRVFVTRFISSELQGSVVEHNGATLANVRTIALLTSGIKDSGDRAAGTPNYLAGIAISPDGTRAAIVSKQDNTRRGIRFGVGDLTHETTVRAVISFVDLTTNSEIFNTRRDFDNSEGPSSVTWSPRGDTMFVTLQGNNSVVGIDALNLAPIPDSPFGIVPDHTTFVAPVTMSFKLGTGLAPQGVLIDPVSNRIFTQNFMGRSVTVLNAQSFLGQNLTTFPLVSTTATVLPANETLNPQVLLGKQIFYNASDPRMAAESYISCASCHIDGGHDGRTWDFTGRGEGFRRTTDLRGRSGTGHGNVHWSGNFDEIQDFEHDIRGPFGGTGFLSLDASQFASLHPTPATGKAGLSADLDALAAYVTSLGNAHTPRSPNRNTNGTRTASAIRGQDIFTANNCASCHSGSSFTNSPLSAITSHPLSNVGTQSLISGNRLGADLTGIDVPTLHGLHATQNFLHHGEAKSLIESFSYTGGNMLLAHQAELIPAPGTSGSIGLPEPWRFDPAQGGGGNSRGLFGGSYVNLSYRTGATAQARVRFNNVDGGSGGNARIALRYLKFGDNGNVVVRVNNVDQTVILTPISIDQDWRWQSTNITLNPGFNNTIEVIIGSPDENSFELNAMLVSNADILAAAAPHRQVLGLPQTSRDDLIAYLLQLDGRNDAGTPLADPTPAVAQAPVILSQSSNTTLAVGNVLNFHVSTSGTGPFTYAWTRNGIPVGTNSAIFHIPALQISDAGTYRVTITNAQGQDTSDPITLTVNSAISIPSATLPNGTVNQAYSTSLSANGGVGARTWSLESGVLPAGISLTSSGQITGTPTAAARTNITVRVTDSSDTATREFSLIIAPVGGFVNDPDLILHYTFDEGSDNQIWDIASGANNHTTNVSTANWVNDGRFGGAYGATATNGDFPHFHPANQADLNFDPLANEFTISTWIRTTDNSDFFSCIFAKNRLEPTYQVQYMVMTVAPPTFISLNVGQQWGAGFNTTAPALNNGQWHLVTLVNYNDSGTWRSRVYYNGGAQYSQFDTGDGGTVDALMSIGAMSTGDHAWVGQLDDFRIYKRALTQQEVANLYSPPASPTVVITRATGQNQSFTRPYAEFDIYFSRPVSGLTVSDFQIGGTSGRSATHLYAVTANEHYRLRIAGFTQSGTLTLRLPAAATIAINNGQSNQISNLISLNYTVPPTPSNVSSTTYDDWLRASLTAGQLVLPSFTDVMADPDADGHFNLLEFALGSHPNNSAGIVLPVFQRTGDTITFTYPRLRGSIQYLVQYSSDLNSWFTAGLNQDAVTPIGETATATMTVTPGTEKIFLRLRVSEP